MKRGDQEGRKYEYLRCIILITAIVISLLISRNFIADYLGAKNDLEGVGLAAKIVPEDARHFYILGLLKYADNDTDSSIKFFSRSLSLNPFDSKTWLGLARSYIDKGEHNSGSYALERAISLDRNTPDILWEAGLLSLMNNDPKMASGLLKRYMSMMPSEQERLYSMLFAIGADSDYIFDNIIPPEYEYRKRYLYFLISNKLIREAMDVWDRMGKMHPEKELYIRYCDFLLSSGHIDKAIKLWDGFLKEFEISREKTDNIIWNGDFEKSLEKGCFDWRTGRAEGVRVFIDRGIFRTGEASLTASFNGQTNPDIYIASQIVPVRQGARYRLLGYMRTENITTKNGIFLEIKGHRCEFNPLRSEPQVGTNLWKRIELDFSIPNGCEAVMIGIRRERSQKFDNRISGDVWIDSLSVTEIKN